MYAKRREEEVTHITSLSTYDRCDALARVSRLSLIHFLLQLQLTAPCRLSLHRNRVLISIVRQCVAYKRCATSHQITAMHTHAVHTMSNILPRHTAAAQEYLCCSICIITTLVSARPFALYTLHFSRDTRVLKKCIIRSGTCSIK